VNFVAIVAPTDGDRELFGYPLKRISSLPSILNPDNPGYQNKNEFHFTIGANINGW
jgi:hypothetical protein